jgi:hypothetical protein
MRPSQGLVSCSDVMEPARWALAPLSSLRVGGTFGDSARALASRGWSSRPCCRGARSRTCATRCIKGCSWWVSTGTTSERGSPPCALARDDMLRRTTQAASLTRCVLYRPSQKIASGDRPTHSGTPRLGRRAVVRDTPRRDRGDDPSPRAACARLRVSVCWLSVAKRQQPITDDVRPVSRV